MGVYLKRVWSLTAFIITMVAKSSFRDLLPEFFRQAVQSVDAATLPLAEGQTVEQLCEEVFPLFSTPR